MNLWSLLSTPSLALWLGCLVAPVCFFIATVAIRWHKDVAQSAPADFVLLILLFDVSVISGHKDFEKLLSDPGLQTNIVSIFLGSLLFCFLAWLASILILEPKLEQYHSGGSHDSLVAHSPFPLIGFAASWIVSVTLLVFHVLIFVHSGA